MLAGVRYGAIFGVVAFASTLAANLAVLVFRPADLCRIGPLSIVLFNLGALLIFLLLAAAAGFAAGRADGTIPSAAVAGVTVGAVSGCAMLVLVGFGPALMHCLLELNALCPDGGSFSFGTDASPPPGFATPPPGLTPPPGVFPAGPGSFGAPSSPVEFVFAAIGLLFGIGVGIGFAAGAASLGGLVGVATRPKASAG